MSSDNGHDDHDGEPVAPDEGGDSRAAAERREKDVETEIFEGVRAEDGGPVVPVRLEGGDSFSFSCHRGISCWNKCCYGADVMLAPYDILRLSRNLGIRPAEFNQRYVVPSMWERADLPVPKLKMGDGGSGACVFLHEEDGCTVYADRPATCRYYPLGLGAIKLKDSPEQTDFHFLVKEPFCKGHDEDKQQSVDSFRAEQGVEAYDRLNHGWIDIMMKLASWKTVGGPHGKDVSTQTKKMFYMVSTDVDAFRRFVFETRFLDTYLIDDEVAKLLKIDDEALLQLGFDWLKNVMFNEPTISLREDVLQRAIAAVREEVGGT